MMKDGYGYTSKETIQSRQFCYSAVIVLLTDDKELARDGTNLNFLDLDAYRYDALFCIKNYMFCRLHLCINVGRTYFLCTTPEIK